MFLNSGCSFAWPQAIYNNYYFSFGSRHFLLTDQYKNTLSLSFLINRLICSFLVLAFPPFTKQVVFFFILPCGQNTVIPRATGSYLTLRRIFQQCRSHKSDLPLRWCHIYLSNCTVKAIRSDFAITKRVDYFTCWLQVWVIPCSI